MPHPNKTRKTAQTKKPNQPTNQTWDEETPAQPIPTKKQKHPKAAATTLPHSSYINKQIMSVAVKTRGGYGNNYKRKTQTTKFICQYERGIGMG